MDQFIRRDPEDADALVAFWEGDAPGEGDQASVDMGDRLLVFDESGVLASFDAGRHVLAAIPSGEDGVYVAFVSQKRYVLDIEGELAEEDLETGYVLRAAVQVRDAAKMVGLIAQVDEAELSVEEWLADEIAIDAAAAASDAGVSLEDVGDQLATVRDAAIAAANEVLSEHGVELMSIDELAFYDVDEDDDD
jgi:hypothetical protein